MSLVENPEQIAEVQRANIEMLFGLVNNVFDGCRQVVDLNLQVVRSTLAEAGGVRVEGRFR
jgi:Phasin protein